MSAFLRLADGDLIRMVEAGPMDGPPVVLVHGWACSVYSWRHQLPILAAAGYRAIAVDLRGHGLSDKPSAGDTYSTDAMTSFLDAALDALRLERVALVGHSLGANICARLAIRRPERVSRMVTVSGVGFGEVALISLVARLPDSLVRRTLPLTTSRLLFRAVLRMVAGAGGRYTVRDVDEYRAATQFPGFMLALWRLVQRYDWSPFTSADLSRLGLPVLAVYGGRDRLVRHDPSHQAAPGNFDSRVISTAGHAAQEELPAELNDLLLPFLAGQRRSAELAANDVPGGAPESSG